MKKIAYKGDKKFCHFTSLENCRNLIYFSQVYLSRYNDMNDLQESELHDDEKDKIFVLSLSHSNSLNIPMFYLYGGIDGKGCKIQFTPAKLSEIINNCEVYYVNNKDLPLKKKVDKGRYEILFDWVYYTTSKGWVEHNGEKHQYNSFDDAMHQLKEENKHYFIKSKIWDYEDEFRIVVKFKENVPHSRIAIRFNIKEKERGISVLCGPEMDAEEVKSVANEFAEYGILNVNGSSEYKVRLKLKDKNKRR